MADPGDMILPLLREMRAEIGQRFDGTDRRFDKIDERLAKLDETMISYRQALTADTLLSKLVTGEFEERLEAPEKKVRELETHD